MFVNLEGGRGRIEDADFALESSNLAKSQILNQAATAMLAQANAPAGNSHFGLIKIIHEYVKAPEGALIFY